MIVFGEAHLRRIWASMPPIMSYEFIARSTKMTRSIGRLSASALSHQAADQDADRAAIADTAAMLFWALLVSGQINIRKVGGWQTLATKPVDQPIDLAA